MKIGITGFKCGMSTLIEESGNFLPVTLLHIPDNIITQLKTQTIDGYNAVQVSLEDYKATKATKATLGHLAASQARPGHLTEFTVAAPQVFSRGQKITAADFLKYKFIDIVSVSKGKGFAGTVRRYGFKTQPASHGNSRSHRVPGSIGQCQDPGRVFPGKKMPGHLGHKRITVQNLRILDIDLENKVMVVKGAVPGPKGAFVIIRPAAKKEAFTC